MSDPIDKELEKIEIAKIAATAAELAASNIRNYIEAHKEFALGPTNDPRQYRGQPAPLNF